VRCAVTSALIVALSLVAACSSKPSLSVATVGKPLEHPKAHFSLTVPDGWEPSLSTRGVSLVRSVPYGGGYPTLNVRRITSGEAEVLHFDGNSFDGVTGRVEYRYQRWRNPRGSGYRLEALLHSSSGMLFADASVWDPAKDLNQAFFDDAFWPIINSVKTR
jgi:hypothetical protein